MLLIPFLKNSAPNNKCKISSEQEKDPKEENQFKINFLKKENLIEN
jgi:hypothetical protein